MKRVMSILLASLLAFSGLECLTGCNKTDESNINQTITSDSVTSSGSSEDIIETTEELLPTIEATPEFVTDITKYIDVVLANFPSKGNNVNDIHQAIMESMDNYDCSWQIYGSEVTYVAFTFNFSDDNERAIFDKIEYSGYTIDLSTVSDPILEDYTQDPAVETGAIYIMLYNEDDAVEFYNQACEYVKTLRSGEVSTQNSKTNTTTFISDSATDTENWTAMIDLKNPTENENYFVLKVAFRNYI